MHTHHARTHAPAHTRPHTPPTYARTYAHAPTAYAPTHAPTAAWGRGSRAREAVHTSIECLQKLGALGGTQSALLGHPGQGWGCVGAWGRFGSSAARASYGERFRLAGHSVPRLIQSEVVVAIRSGTRDRVAGTAFTRSASSAWQINFWIRFQHGHASCQHGPSSGPPCTLLLRSPAA